MSLCVAVCAPFGISSPVGLGTHHGVLTFALGRAPVGEDGWEPNYPAAFLLPALWTIPGAQHPMDIANIIQDGVIRRLNTDDTEGDDADKYDQTAVRWGVLSCLVRKRQG